MYDLIFSKFDGQPTNLSPIVATIDLAMESIPECLFKTEILVPKQLHTFVQERFCQKYGSLHMKFGYQLRK